MYGTFEISNNKPNQLFANMILSKKLIKRSTNNIYLFQVAVTGAMCMRFFDRISSLVNSFTFYFYFGYELLGITMLHPLSKFS